MEDFFQIPDNEMSVTLRVLREILQKRGWRATVARGKTYFLNLVRPDGKELRLYSCTPPTTSYCSGVMADDKLASYQFMKEIGVKQPETWRVTDENKEEIAQRMLAKYGKVVVKPIDGAHGNGVYTGLSSMSEVLAALDQNADCVNIIQEQLESKTPELRVICVNYEFVGAFARIPASVTGDGEHTVRELIKIENTTIRTAPYKSNLSFIDEKMAEDYLKKHPIGEEIPEKGKKVQVVAMCNTGRGGTMEDVTDQIPEEQRRLSEKIAKTLGLPVIGVDFWDDYVIEVNSSPALYHPVEGKMATFCVEKFVDYLETL